MKLSDLLLGVKVLETFGNLETEIEDITTDSNSVIQGSLYICQTGYVVDGHEYVNQAEKYGAVAIITERKIASSLPQVIVESGRRAVSIIAGNFYGNCHKKMKLIGVVGTNGKTTTTYMITSILNEGGVKCGLIGTLGIFYDGKVFENTLTTPDPIVLHKTLKDMYACGVETVVMEVSAHAVYLEKVYGLNFEVGVFTNFSQDHLDFFSDMEEYKKAKIKFFTEIPCKYVVINSDDEVGLEIVKAVKQPITYGIINPSDVFAMDIKQKPSGISFVMNLFDCIYDVKINMIGEYNVYNSLAASACTALYGINTDKIAEGLENLKGVSGRLENVYDGEYSIFIDYAHTPDGLEKTLKTLGDICSNRLISVFGCGGNRDKGKRSIMGTISADNADFTVITSDNPRFEDPMDIIGQIEEGVMQITNKYVVIQDREEAIKYAISMAKRGDIILVAGKGSEKYQEVFGIKRLYNDKDTIEEFLRDKK